MTNDMKNGGPAFARTGAAYIVNGNPIDCPGQSGMSLRDWFAGQALAGILADNSSVHPELLHLFGGPGMTRGDAAAKCAYAVADAMLAAREKRS